MRRFLIATPLFCALTLSACNFAPKYASPDLPVPPSLPSGPAYPAPAADGIIPADVAWRDFFIDPKLREVIALALVNNRDLRIALANIAQARAQFQVQGAAQLPSLSAGAGDTTQLSSRSTTAASAPRRSDVVSAELTVPSWEIDLFGRVHNLTKESYESYLASTEARNAAQVALIGEVARAYLTIAADQDGLRIAKDTMAAFGKTLDLNRARFKIGVSSELDVRQAETSYDDARAQIASRTTLVAQDVNALALLTGSPVPAGLLPAGLPTTGITLTNLPANLSSDILLRRPDIAEAEHKLRAANTDIGAARAAFFPRISLTAALGSVSIGLSNLFASGNGTWSVAPSATIPIFDVGRNQANLRYSKASRDAAVAQYEKAIQSGFRDVADSLARRGTITQQLEAQAALRNASARSYVLSDARFRAGIDPFLTTLDSQRALYTAEQNLVATRLVAATNLVSLYAALGGGLK